MLVIFGGAFLITPGFITDVVGILLLLPPTRVVMRAFVVRAARRARGDRRGGRRPTRRRRAADYDVEGTATEVDDQLEPRTPRLPR